MPELTQHVQTNIDAKADERELDCGTVLSWNGRYGFARADRSGPDIYLGQPELARAGIPRLEIGLRVCFEVCRATLGRKPWAAKIRLAEAPA